MRYPIVSIKTRDGLDLEGLFFEPENHKNLIKIHIHGTSGSFFFNNYYEKLISSSLELGISHLTTNNRGTGVYEIEKGTISHGASLEKFEDCVQDIDAWIEFALAKGYKRVILEGHSFGTEKSVYYMNRGTHADKVIAVILMGFSDNVGTQQKYEKKIDRNYFDEANALVKQGKGEYLLDDMGGLAGEMPISAQTYLNYFSPNSENSKALPLRQGKDLQFFRNINVPVLGVIGDNYDGEYTIIPIEEAVELLKSENKLAEAYQIKDCDHGFNGKEKEVVELIADFLKRRVLV